MPPISGYEKSSVHRRSTPNRLPACEYVAIPLGSSSAAPVMRPGPHRVTSARQDRPLSAAMFPRGGVRACRAVSTARPTLTPRLAIARAVRTVGDVAVGDVVVSGFKFV